jgi:endonuclease/exonuclease/phosphatase family metal-dependent hydrolase
MFRLLLLLPVGPAAAGPVFVNELHYDNAGADAQEGVEVAGPAGTVLSDYSLAFCNGTGGGEYLTVNLSGVIPSESGTGFGAVWVPVSGIQNGAPDGLVLYRRSTREILQMLSWEGELVATAGVASGRTLPDIGVSQNGSDTAEQTLQLTGRGNTAAQFQWAGPRQASRGRLNAGQEITGAGQQVTAAAFVPSQLREGGSVLLEIRMDPPPAAPVELRLRMDPPGTLSLPERLVVPAGGLLSLAVAAPSDGVVSGYRNVVLELSDATGQRNPASAVLGIIDGDRPRGAPSGSLRVMSFNVLTGVGATGSDAGRAAREVIERISPDVILFQEVASAGDFGDLVALLREAGFPATAETLALRGDDFAGEPLVRGDLSGTQDAAVVVASRWPLRQRVQIGRGMSGRREITRYPMFAVVDVPWLEAADDPAVVSLHLKASRSDADSFRRALELYRLREGLAALGFGGGPQPLVVGGDFNETDWMPQAVSYRTDAAAVQVPGTPFADGSSLPVSFLAGADLASGIVLPYRVFPHSGMNPAGLRALDLRQGDGVNAVTWPGGEAKLDYLFVSERLAAMGASSGEIFESRVDAWADGLPKRAASADAVLSTEASDHLAVFADIPMQEMPGLGMELKMPRLEEGAAGSELTVRLTAPSDRDVTVSLRSWRDGRLRIPDLLIPAGSLTGTVPLDVPWLVSPEPHRFVMIEATAAGFRPAYARLEVRNREASGQLIITEYAEPSGAGGGRAIEVMNVSGETIDFAGQPLLVRRFSNGASDGINDARVSSGWLGPGHVVVIGDEAAGQALVAQGWLAAADFASAPDGTVYRQADGRAVFVCDRMSFTGNDALELVLGAQRCDVFGEIGHNPGDAWRGPGNESTADAVLQLRGTVATGSGGWREPGRRFALGPAGLAGFGAPPLITDPWIAWAASAGLTGLRAAPTSDADGDGAMNLLEYGMLSAPADGASLPFMAPDPGGITRTLRTSDAALRFTVDESDDLRTWRQAAGVETVLQSLPGGDVRARFDPRNWAGGSPRWYRQRVVRE